MWMKKKKTVEHNGNRICQASQLNRVYGLK